MKKYFKFITTSKIIFIKKAISLNARKKLNILIIIKNIAKLLQILHIELLISDGFMVKK